MRRELAYPLVCFDLDGTLVDDTVFIWQTLHDQLATDKAARHEAHRQYFAKQITYKQWFERDLELFVRAGATEGHIRAILKTLRPMPGAHQLLNELKQRGHILAVVSGSLDIVVDELFGDFEFDHLLINRIHFDEKGRITGGTHTPYDFEGKARGIKMLAQKEDLPLSATAFIGDNDNDRWAAEAAGLSIAFNCKSDALRQTCDVEVSSKDLIALLPILEGTVKNAWRA